MEFDKKQIRRLWGHRDELAKKCGITYSKLRRILSGHYVKETEDIRLIKAEAKKIIERPEIPIETFNKKQIKRLWGHRAEIARKTGLTYMYVGQILNGHTKQNTERTKLAIAEAKKILETPEVPAITFDCKEIKLLSGYYSAIARYCNVSPCYIKDILTGRRNQNTLTAQEIARKAKSIIEALYN